MEPYFVRRIQEAEGWDIIDADFPSRPDSQLMYGEASKLAAATYVARRLKELKAQGYAHIFVGGQSVGGWTALVLSTQRGLPLDGTILLVPACCAWGPGNDAVPSHPEFANNKLYFDQLIQRVLYPTVAVFFDQDSFEPADRGAGAAATLTQHGLPNLVIDHPPGFQGHGAGWLPVFDFGYRECIVGFLRAPRTTQCKPLAIAAKDFRTMFTSAQLGDWKASKPSAADLIGKEFAVYPTGYLYKIVSESQTELKDYDFGDGLLTSSFRDGTYCVRGRIRYQLPVSTDEVCTTLVRWSSRELLALDEKSGTVLQWWVQKDK
jgi:pimeloyl-ACP methyl ester carboxylesterase